METEAVRKVMERVIEKRRRRRPKKKWLDTIENDSIWAAGVFIGDVEGRSKWRFRIRMADFKKFRTRRKIKRRL